MSMILVRTSSCQGTILARVTHHVHQHPVSCNTSCGSKIGDCKTHILCRQSGPDCITIVERNQKFLNSCRGVREKGRKGEREGGRGKERDKVLHTGGVRKKGREETETAKGKEENVTEGTCFTPPVTHKMESKFLRPRNPHHHEAQVQPLALRRTTQCHHIAPACREECCERNIGPLHKYKSLKQRARERMTRNLKRMYTQTLPSHAETYSRFNKNIPRRGTLCSTVEGHSSLSPMLACPCPLTK